MNININKNTNVSKNKDPKGQSIFEFIVIMPLLLVFYAVFVSVTGSINGSINQLKVTRGFFYYRLKHDSTFPPRFDLETPKSQGVTIMGLVSSGWAEKLENGLVPYAPCYRITTFVGELPSDEDCGQPVNGDISTFIKVKTLYGLCGQSYNLESSSPTYDHTQPNSENSCSMKL